jgi:hypothetical protein
MTIWTVLNSSHEESQMEVVPSRFDSTQPWQNETEAQQLMGDMTNELASIKIRPVSPDGWDRYVYAKEYEEIWAQLGPELRRGNVGTGKPENAAIYQEADSNEKFCVAEHETGPEIIVVLALITAGLGLIDKLVGLAKTIIETINRHSELKKSSGVPGEGQFAPGERYFPAEGISFEIRTRDGSKRIAYYELGPGVEIDEKALSAFIMHAVQTKPSV